MSAYAYWDAEKPKLRELLRDAGDKGGAVFAVRHILAQVEQNLMAEQPDERLRQQAGILLSCIKTSAGFLDVSIAAKLWEARSVREERPVKGGAVPLWILAGLAQLGAGLYCYGRGEWIAWLLMALAVLLLLSALLSKRSREKGGGIAPEEKLKVTLRLEEERLFQILDGQMQAVDRYLNDFAYLNEQAAGQRATPDSRTVSLAADMLEALYECDGDAREGAVDAASRMLEGLGLEAVPYSGDTRRLFTVLPSMDTTRTMIPAIVTADDCRLLRRGVAAVQRMEPAS